ncbi:hypothetical protein JTE90_005225 [Oedothorax gibbosus]|uniref:Reverse transcriptase RNase H-like domain-containing protein n=1 Tax=Oedothorax gibbosus TaxID=931172 RepID=A0AAV6TLV7_9ARAC|nr:hypothetical protein JTE90_005225 [Oedothorax gibbosus]
MPKSAMPSSNLRSTFVIVTDHKALSTPRLLAAHRRKTERDFELPYATSKKHLEPANEKYVQMAQRRCHAIETTRIRNQTMWRRHHRLSEEPCRRGPVTGHRQGLEKPK